MRIFRALYVRYKDLGELTKKYSNLPESYIKRKMIQVEYKTPRGFPQYLPRTLQREDYYFDIHRPWTEEFRKDNEIGKKIKKVYVEPIKDWSFFKGDRVEILKGKDKGKQGTVAQIIQERNWVIVEGLNCKKELIGKTKTQPGVYLQTEQPLLVTTDVALVDPADTKPVTIEWRYTEEGEKVRVSVRTGRIIPIPHQAEETYDYKIKAAYKESEKDTTAGDVLNITFKPALETFEMSIMREMGIEEDRVPVPTYWY